MPNKPSWLSEKILTSWDPPMSFMATILSFEPNALVYKGAVMEYYVPSEGPTTIVPTNQVRCLYSADTMQVFVLEVVDEPAVVP